MKKFLIAIPLLLVTCFSYSQTDELKADSEIKNVTLYFTGAEITQSGSVKIKPGKNKINIHGLSPYIDSKTITVSFRQKDIKILSVSSQINHIEKGNETKEIIGYKDSLFSLKKNILQKQSKMSVLESEKQLLFKNEAIGGVSQGVKVEEIEKAANFYRKRVSEINLGLLELNDELEILTQKQQNIEKQLLSLKAVNNRPTSNTFIEVQSASSQTVEFTIVYFTTYCGWAPIYDIRLESTDKPIKLSFRANLFNASGGDWKNIKLKLSTADPTVSAEKPLLQKWVIGPDYNNNTYSDNKNNVQKLVLQQTDQNALTSIDIENVVIEVLSEEYEINEPYTILSDAKKYTIDVKEFELPAKYEYYCAPSANNGVFMTAKISGWRTLNIIPGHSNIYNTGTYIGNAYINPIEIEDTLSISLGKDKTIVQDVKTLVNETKELAGGKRREKVLYEISFKNTKNSAIEIEVHDQVPVSNHKDYTVNIDEISNAAYEESSGMLMWKITLQPGETKKINLGFSIKYPKEDNSYQHNYKSINLSRRNTMRGQPKF